MVACHIFRQLAIGVILLPYLSTAQSNYVNEVNIHAYRDFYKHWPSVAGEVWNKTAEGFVVTFMEGPVRDRVFFNVRGRFLIAVKYYTGDYISPELADMVYKKYPGYAIKVVTEITDRNKSSYLVNIRNPSSIKNLSITDGRMELRDELINGDPFWN
jgi:alpha-galactosidase/6-phospho-beta-glucosidase family protein